MKPRLLARIWEGRVPESGRGEIATVYGLAGEDSLTLDWLERGFEEHDPGVPYLSAWPPIESLHDDPRYHDLRRRVNLPQ